MLIKENLIDVFSREVEKIKCEDLTRAYIVSILGKYKTSETDFSKYSLTTLYQKASEDGNFIVFQNIGDWIFFCHSLFPEFVKYYNDYSVELARLSYDRCYRLINRQLKVYQNMSDDFKYLTSTTRKIIHNI